MQNERIAIRFTSPGKNQFLLKPFILVFEFAIQINDAKRFSKCFKAYDVYGYSDGDIDTRWWYRELDALSGMEFCLLNIFPF